MRPIIDPRRGDVEDDACSTKRRSLLSLAGSLLAEISLPKLVFAWMLLLVVPSIMLGLAPLVASAWVSAVSGKISSPLAGIWPALLLAIVVALGWFGGRPLFRMAESSFWSLNSLAVEPGYAACREALRHLAERLLRSRTTDAQLATLRAATAAAAGVMICAVALLTLMLAWPHSRWVGDISNIASLHLLAPVALANSIVLVAAYLAAAALVWAVADATMAQPRDLHRFHARPEGGRSWRIAHLSDIHMVGERYGFRIESGRSGPRGNERLRQALAQLDALHAQDPLDAILITGDMTDAGSSAEWAELLDALAAHPRLAERVLALPGNHDLNIVDRANPARLDLPTSPNKRLRQMRALSTMAALQGRRVHVVDRARGCLGESLAKTLDPHLGKMSTFADTGRPWRSQALGELWADVFPMVLPPDRDDGLGILPIELECRHPLLLHQCARDDFSGAGPRHRDRDRAAPASLLDHRPPPPCHRVSQDGESTFRAHRNGPDQRQLVRSSIAAPGGPGGPHARSSAHRLDRRVCGPAHSVGPVSGHGGDRRHADVFLHPYVGVRLRRTPSTALATAAHDRRPGS